MFHAEDHNLMVLEQYGSQTEKLAAIQCLNKRLLYNHMCCNHIPMALCSNDAKSCYDRIILIMAALCLCQLGADKASVQSMVGTLHGMHHHVRSNLWRLSNCARMQRMEKTDSRHQSRKRSRPANLGSG